MKITLRLSSLLAFLLVVSNAFAQQAVSRDCPGVPGACGFHSTIPSTQRSGPNQAPQNGNGTLGQIYNFSKCGLNFATASQRMGQRFSPIGVPQPAPFAISGIPACATIEKAFLWAEGSGNGAAQTATIVNPAAATFNYPMTIAGNGPDKCWGYSGSYTYRADVTSCISGNGTYNISGLLTSPPNSGNDMDGATLMVIWSDPTATYRGTMVIHDGAVVINGGTTTQTVTGLGVCQNTNNATAFCMIGDVQFAMTSLTMNGTNAPFAWNWWNYVSVPTTLTNGQATANYIPNSSGDCYNLCVAGMYYQTTSCTVCPAPSSLTVTTSSTPATCSNCNGSATVSVSPPGSYTYSWSPSGGNAATATGLCAGTYTCTITAACVSQTVAVTVGSAGGGITLTGSQVNVACFGQCNGTATTTASGGSAPYTYTWSPAATNSTVGATNTATGLCAGTYTINCTDANGCTGSRTITITQPPVLASTGSQVNVLCNGQCTGSATVVASGGTPAYTYLWSPSGGSAPTATGLCAGTYTCTITDSKGCTTTRTFTITQPPALSSTGSQVNVLCNGQCTGSATVVASGGTPTYTYLWAPSGGTGPTASALCSGNYTCTITDANGCTTTRSFAITQPTALTTTGSQVNILCNGQCTGSATVVASGGTPTYTYLWAPSGGTGPTASALCSGNYTCTVTDANGCTTTRTFNITQPPLLTTTGSQVNVLCNGQCTGSATVVASGGSPAYTYAWSPTGGNSPTASNLCPGTYTCTVTDVNGCTTTRTFNITQPTALASTGSQVNILCYGQCTGSATVVASGGTPAYSYLWAPSGGTGPTASALCSGTYTCTITDANGCTTTRTFNITQPAVALSTTGTQVNVLCFNACTGSASVVASGGTPGYTYLWSPSGGTGPTASALCAGNYTCTVTDANGCTTTRTFAITQPPTPLSTTGTQVNVLCSGPCSGSATVSAAGGTPGYTYLWAPSGGNAATASSLCSGTYTCTVTDANGCVTTRTFNITQPSTLSSTGSQVNVLCFGQCTGSATVVALGGSPAYTYLWAPSGGSGPTASALCAGTYTCTITDANGCTTTQSFNITQPPAALSTTGTQVNVLCYGQCTGSASVVASGGTPTYTYAWSPSGGTGATASALCAGNYTCTITDANGCTTTRTFAITQPPSALSTTGSQVNVLCNGQCTGSATVVASGGTPTYTYLWAPSGGNNATASSLCAGTYTCTITDVNGCTTTRTFSITQPPALTATATSVAATCGNNNGSATVTAGGGSPTYTYVWTPNVSTTNTATNLAPGSYSILVTDLNGCSVTTTVTVSPSSAIAMTTSSTNVLCFGGNTGSASVTVTNSTGTVTYVWAPNVSTTNTASNLTAGAYVVSATDALGCTITATINITQPPQLTATSTSSNVLCFGGNTGSASVTAAGGSTPYTYTWSPSGGNGPAASNLAVGTYTCTISDSHGCVLTQSFNITQPPAITLTPAVTNTTCGNANGNIVVTPGGGSPSFLWVWSPNVGNAATVSNILAQNYVCTATDQNGCSLTITVTVTDAGSPTAQITASTPVSCNGGNDGSATATASSGTGPYTYAWSSGGTNPTETGLGQGQYVVTVTDANGCQDTAMVTINEPTPLAATTSQVDVLCFGNTTGSATVIASGATPTYSYLWTSGGTNATEPNIGAGNYSCTITDANGCTLTSSFTITEPPLLTLTTTSTNVLCNSGNTGSATATVAGGSPTYTYAWSSGGNQSTENNLSANVYTITITDANGCTAIDTFTITEPSAMTLAMSASDEHCNQSNGTVGVVATGGNPTYQYLWQPGNLAQQNGSGLPSNTYAVTVTDNNGCTATDSVTVNNLAGVSATLVSTTNVNCFGDCNGSVTISATGGNPTYTYAWSSGGNAATENNLCIGNYSCIVTDQDGCTSTVNAVILQPAQLTVAVAAQASWPSICNGNSAPLFALANGGSPTYTYIWTPGPVNGNNPSVSPTTTTTYVVTATDSHGCSVVDSMVVTINPVPVATVSSDVTSGCVPLSVNFLDVSTVSSPGTITSWFWDFGDGNTSTQQNPSHLYGTPGPYTVTLTVTTADGCTNTIVMNNYINVFALPTAAFSAGPQPTTELNPHITFVDQSVSATGWVWSFGDLLGSSSTDQNTEFTYPGPGCYEVVLTVTSADGCTDMASDSICIDPDVTLYVPNAFSPNGDGTNDVFLAQAIGIDADQFEMWVFDRWGNMIFYSDDLYTGWDGKVLGYDNLCQVDVYVWKIKAVDQLGKKHNLLGRVSLVR